MVKVERLVLHAGLPKTGTTSIQRLLYDNRPRLLDLGVDYPEPLTSPTDPKHDFLVDDIFNARMDRLGSVLSSARTPTVLLSIESLSGRLPLAPPEGLKAFREATSSTDVTIHFVTREPAAWSRSYWKQHALLEGDVDTGCGHALPLGEFVRLDRLRQLLDFDEMTSRLARSYGGSVVRHDMEAGLELVVAGLVGSPASEPWMVPESVHPSIGDDEMALVLAVNAVTSTRPELRRAFRTCFQLALDTGHEELKKFARWHPVNRRQALEVWKLLDGLVIEDPQVQPLRSQVSAFARHVFLGG